MRNGDWLQTYTGRKFYPLDPRPEDICIVDIAHALAHTCRFGGHCREFYSVAQHSVIVSANCPNFPLHGLLHDATEAYLGDMVKPLKVSMDEYMNTEARLSRVVAEKFGLCYERPEFAEVKRADLRALLTEKRDVCMPSEHRWSAEDLSLLPFAEVILPWSSVAAEMEFLSRFQSLNGQCCQ